MKTTVKRTSLCLTKESKRQLEEIVIKLGETQSYVIKMAISLLHNKIKGNRK